MAKNRQKDDPGRVKTKTGNSRLHPGSSARALEVRESELEEYVVRSIRHMQTASATPIGGRRGRVVANGESLEFSEGDSASRGLALVVAMPETHLTSFEKIDLIRQGIPKKSLEYFKQKSGLDYDQLANLLSVARATLINKKANEKFNQALSERILRLADIYSQGYEVFGDLERFNSWIFRPNRALGGKAPYDLLDNDYGREEVGNLIGRIDAGVYS